MWKNCRSHHGFLGRVWVVFQYPARVLARVRARARVPARVPGEGVCKGVSKVASEGVR